MTSGAQSAGNTKTELAKRRAGGAQTAGNTKTELAKRRAGGAQTAGNTKTELAKRRAGGAQTAGNTKTELAKRRAGGAQTDGNRTTGIVKTAAGKRSGLKRSAKFALVVKKHWLDKILAGEKDWEIRGSSTTRRGWMHFAESKGGGKLVGRARLVDCIKIPKDTFQSHAHRHLVTNVADVPYQFIFAWVLEDAERFTEPFVYSHTPGAVIWVKV
jgi:hypothetical protein